MCLRRGSSCSPLMRMPAFTKIGKLVCFSKLWMSRSHDLMSFWASPLNLPFKMPNNMLVKRLLDFGSHCSWRPRHAPKPSPSPPACTLFRRTVLRQERQHTIVLDAEGLLEGTQDNVPTHRRSSPPLSPAACGYPAAPPVCTPS